MGGLVTGEAAVPFAARPLRFDRGDGGGGRLALVGEVERAPVLVALGAGDGVFPDEAGRREGGGGAFGGVARPTVAEARWLPAVVGA